MAKTSFESVDQYIAAQAEAAQAALERVRAVIRKAMPDADEVISYQIPAYKLHGRAALYFAGWKEHFSLYPTTAPLIEAFRDDLAPYEVSKGTIRFPLSQPVPVELIERIANFRVQEAAERAASKRRTPKRPASRRAPPKRTASRRPASKREAPKRKGARRAGRKER